MSASTKIPWYVEYSPEDIRGPIDSMAIVQALAGGTLTVVHRVSRDKVTWAAICNTEHFETLIRNLVEDLSSTLKSYSPEKQNAKAVMKDDSSGFYNANDISKGINEQLADAQKLTEINIGANSLRKVLINISIQKKAVITVQAQKPSGLHPNDSDVFILPNPTGPAFSWKTHPKLFFFSVVTMILAVGQVSYWMYERREEKIKAEQARRVAREAQEAKLLGDYDRVAGLYKSVKDLEILDVQTLLNMAEVEIHQNKMDEGQELCQKVLSLSSNAVERAKAHSLLGLINTKKGDLASADRDFQTSLQEKANLYSALHNLGIVYLRRESYDIAETILLKALTVTEQKEAATLLALFETALALEGKNPSGSTAFPRLTRVDDMLEQFSKGSPDLKGEILLARARIATLKKNQPMAEKFIRQFVSENPAQIASRQYKLDLNYERLSWDKLYSWCYESYLGSSSKALATAFIGGCLIQTRQLPQALNNLKYAYLLSSKDPQIKALYGYTLVASGQEGEVKKLFAKDDENALSPLALSSLAKACEKESNQTCATKYWNRVLVLKPNDPTAMNALAHKESKRIPASR